MQDMHVPSVGRGGLGSSSQAPTGSIGIYEDEDENDEEVDHRHEELGPSQLHDAPSTQPTHPAGTRRAVHLTLSHQAPTLLVTRVRVRLEDS
jgi:hypothetical protein